LSMILFPDWVPLLYAEGGLPAGEVIAQDCRPSKTKSP
jgi:hypothetical protein